METRPKYTLFPTGKPPSPSRSRRHPPPDAPFPEDLIPVPGTLALPDEPLSHLEDSYEPENMHAPRPSDSSDSSDLSFHKPTNLSCAPPLPTRRNRPKTVYIHNGIGGRGNYHKMIKGNDNVSNQTLQPAPSRRQNSRFLSSLFGSKKGQTQQQHPESGSSGSSQSSSQTLSLGAAEVMRRKMLGQRVEGKRSTSSNRS